MPRFLPGWIMVRRRQQDLQPRQPERTTGLAAWQETTLSRGGSIALGDGAGLRGLALFRGWNVPATRQSPAPQGRLSVRDDGNAADSRKGGWWRRGGSLGANLGPADGGARAAVVVLARKIRARWEGGNLLCGVRRWSSESRCRCRRSGVQAIPAFAYDQHADVRVAIGDRRSGSEDEPGQCRHESGADDCRVSGCASRGSEGREAMEVLRFAWAARTGARRFRDRGAGCSPR